MLGHGNLTTANQYLGQTQVSTFPLTTNSPNFGHLVLSVTKKVSVERGHTLLCLDIDTRIQGLFGAVVES